MRESPESRTVVGFDWPVFLRVLRSEQYLDCTQAELAARLEVSVSTVTKWEAGAVKPQPRHRRSLRAAATRARYRQKDWPRGRFLV